MRSKRGRRRELVCAKDIREYDVHSRMMTMGPQRWVTGMNGVWTG